MKRERTTILYVEDDEDDREFFSDAINKVNPAVDLVMVVNGQEALDYLDRLSSEAPGHPSLIVLDLNLPFVDGKEVFQRIRQDSSLNVIPVIVFSSGDHPGDKALFSQLGIEYINKPTNISHMSTIATHMLDVANRSMV